MVIVFRRRATEPQTLARTLQLGRHRPRIIVGMRLQRIATAKLDPEYRPSTWIGQKTATSYDGPACEYYKN